VRGWLIGCIFFFQPYRLSFIENLFMDTLSSKQTTITTETSIFTNEYDKEVLQENLKFDLRKTRDSLFIIAAVLLLSDLLGLSMANALNGSMLIYVIVFPVIFVGLAFVATAKPMLAMTIGVLLFALIVAFSIYAMGGRAIISGLLVKAVIVYLFIKGFNHAKEAEKARKDLSMYR